MKKLMFCLPLLALFLVMTSCHDFNEMDSPPPPDDLPQIAIDFIQENFAGFSIVSVEEEDLCDNTIVFEVELEDGPDVDVDLYFSLDGDFLFAAITSSKYHFSSFTIHRLASMLKLNFNPFSFSCGHQKLV